MDSNPDGFPHPNSHDRRRKYRLRRLMRREAVASRAAAAGATPSGAVPEGTHGSREPELKAALAVASGELAAVREELQKVREEAAAEVVRARAEMENQRRRLNRDRDEYRKTAAADVLQRLLPPLDHFELAMKSAATAADVKSLAEGVGLIHRELLQVLDACGLLRIMPVGERFDPNFHEAIGTVADPDKPAQEVVEVFRSGYSLNGRVLRPAMVRVNVGATPAEDEKSPAAQATPE